MADVLHVLQNKMHHTFEPNANIYWSRVFAVIAIVSTFGILPVVLPTNSDSNGFTIVILAIGFIALAILVYVRPKQLTLSIDQAGVTVVDQSHRILISKNLDKVSEVRLAKWGHILNFPIGWISVLEVGQSKPMYFGPVSGRGLSEDVIYKVHATLDIIKAEQAASSNP